MKITVIDFIIHALAVYRLALMVTKEAGLGWVFKHLRQWVTRRAPKWTHMEEGIECLWCMSAQLALIVATARFFLAGAPFYDVIILALALSGAAIIVHQQFAKSK